jgi:transposase
LHKEPEAIIPLLKRESEILRGEIAQLRKAIDEKDALIKDLQEQIDALKEENQALRQELFGLKRTKGGKKGNAPGSAAQIPKKRGPPFGHQGSSRKKPEAKRVDKTVVLRLEVCPCCGGGLKEVETVRERYEEEIVPIPTLVIRYLIKGGYCARCGKVVYPEVPETIGNRHFGVHFLLYVAYLRYVMNMPENKIATLLNDTYDARVSVGTVVAYLKKAAELFGDEYGRLKKELRNARICHYDDTGQRVNGENRWLWTFLTTEAVLYLTRRNRGKKVVVEVLGEDYDGVSTQDFYPSFDSAPGRKQKCWSHLLVAARKLVEQKKPPPRSYEFYEGLAEIYEDAKAFERTLTSAEDRERAFAELVGRLEWFATQEGVWEDHRLKTLAKRALKYSRELFTFIICPGVEPTNNAAERALRPRVRQRKIWGCFRTEKGSENADILMSALETMRKQRKDFFIHGKTYVLGKLSQKGE